MKRLLHPNIVRYIGTSYADVISTDQHLNIVMEYIENGSLAAIVKHYSPFNERLVARFVKQTLEGLHYLHSQGVVHRDLKGANLLTDKDGVLKLADFGVAAKLTDSIKTPGIVGTPYWMAPEAIEDTHHNSTACDIWSLGCTVIELLTGSPPHYDLQPLSALYRIVQDDCPPLPSGLSPLLQEFLLKCFQKNPELRADAQSLLQHPWLNEESEYISEDNPDNTPENTPEQLSEPHTEQFSEKFPEKNTEEEPDRVSDKISSALSSRTLIEMPRTLPETLADRNEAHTVRESHWPETGELTSHPSAELEQLLIKLERGVHVKETLTALLALLKQWPDSKESFTPCFSLVKQLLEECEETDTLHLGLQLVNAVCDGDQECQELAGCTGLFCAVLRFLGQENSVELRFEAAYLVCQAFESTSYITKLMLASGGTEALVGLLDLHTTDNKGLLVLGIERLLYLAQTYGDDCLQVWADCDAVEHLVVVLDNLNAESDVAEFLEKAAELLLLFSQTSLNVLQLMCQPEVLKTLTTTMHTLPPRAKHLVLATLQNLCSHTSLRNQLENAGIVVDLSDVLKADPDHHQAALSALDLLCNASAARQEQAVLAGVVPALCEILGTCKPLAGQVLTLLASFVTASPAVRRILRQCSVLSCLVTAAKENAVALKAVAWWMQAEAEYCEEVLCCPENIHQLMTAYVCSTQPVQIVKYLHRLLAQSRTLCCRLGFAPALLTTTAQRLSEFIHNTDLAAACLKLLSTVVSAHPTPAGVLETYGFLRLAHLILQHAERQELVELQDATCKIIELGRTKKSQVIYVEVFCITLLCLRLENKFKLQMAVDY